MWIVHYMRWIMLVSGVLTVTMVQAAIAPDAALQSNFGETVSGSLAHLVVRNWGAPIALVGGMLLYGAFNPLQRPLVLIVAGASKVIFVALVLSEGTRYLMAARLFTARAAAMGTRIGPEVIVRR